MMTTHTAFHAEKPIVTTHPVNGGDPLIFTITPTADPTLVRPWDQEHKNQIAVVCPDLANLTGVIDAGCAQVAPGV